MSVPPHVLPLERLRRFLHHQRHILLALLLLLLAARLVLVVAHFYVPPGYDARAYLAAARAVVQGHDLLDPASAALLPEATPPPLRPDFPAVPLYLYPPLLAILLVPLAYLPFTSAMALWLGVVVATSLLLIPALRPFVGWKLAVLAVIGFAPVWQGAWLGQIDALVALLLVLGVLAAQRRQDAWSGSWFTLGALFKLTPAVALLVLLMRGWWRAIGVSIALVAVIVVLTVPIVGLRAWFDGAILAASQAWAVRGLLSWTALLHRALGEVGYWMGFPVVLGFAGLTLWRSRQISPLLALATAILLPLLVARITWEHHSVMALPALAVLWQWSGRGRWLAGASWVGISLVGGPMMPLALTACWLACCWPKILGR